MTSERETILSYQNCLLLGKAFNIKTKESNQHAEERRYYEEKKKALRKKKQDGEEYTEDDMDLLREIADYNRRVQEGQRRIDEGKERQALAVVRFIITKLLGWTPEEAMECLDEEVAKPMRFDLLTRHVIYPAGFNPDKDYDYLVAKAFGIPYDLKKQTLKMYRKIVDGERGRFPKEVFTKDEYGERRLAILLDEFITKNIPTYNIETLYEIFGDSAKANKMLQEAGLYHAYRDVYNTPLEYLHHSLGKNKNDFFFLYHEHKNCMAEIKADEKRRETQKRKAEKRKEAVRGKADAAK